MECAACRIKFQISLRIVIVLLHLTLWHSVKLLERIPFIQLNTVKCRPAKLMKRQFVVTRLEAPEVERKFPK